VVGVEPVGAHVVHAEDEGAQHDTVAAVVRRVRAVGDAHRALLRRAASLDGGSRALCNRLRSDQAKEICDGGPALHVAVVDAAGIETAVLGPLALTCARAVAADVCDAEPGLVRRVPLLQPEGENVRGPLGLEAVVHGSVRLCRQLGAEGNVRARSRRFPSDLLALAWT